MKQFLIILLTALVPFSGIGQETLNKKDASGRRQGHWIKVDSAGKKVYDGQFTDNIPKGTFKYFFPNGSTKAISVFSDDGKTTLTTTFFFNGKKNAEGKYVNEKREGLWRFFSEYDGSLVSEENYIGGKKNGLEKTYYSGKNVVEVITWKNGLRDGSWIQYYNDGAVKLQGSYKNDLKEGPMTVFYPAGQKFNTGQYLHGYPDGRWQSWNVDGKLISTDIYDHGVLVKTDKKPEPPPTKIDVKEE